MLTQQDFEGTQERCGEHKDREVLTESPLVVLSSVHRTLCLNPLQFGNYGDDDSRVHESSNQDECAQKRVLAECLLHECHAEKAEVAKALQERQDNDSGGVSIELLFGVVVRAWPVRFPSNHCDDDEEQRLREAEDESEPARCRSLFFGAEPERDGVAATA